MGRGGDGDVRGQEESSWLTGCGKRSWWRREGRGGKRLVDMIWGEEWVEKREERRQEVD